MISRLSKQSFRAARGFTPMSTSSIKLTSRPADWKATAPDPLPGTLTFASQSSLPKLPVMDLEKTMEQLTHSLKPMAWSAAEYETAEKKIMDFAQGKGLELQRRLRERSENTKHWLENWWDDGGYQGYRDSVVVNVSYYYGFDGHPKHLPQTPAARAAGIARAAMIFRQKLKRGLIKPDGTKDGALCMDTYRWMFDCCRVPGPEGLDWSVTYAKAGDLGDSGHLVVFRKNRAWKVDVTQDGRILSTEEIEKQIQHIYDNTTGEYPGVGVLTASNRDIWAKDYNNLASSSHNSSILHAIQSAAFVICLDSSAPTNEVHYSRALWHGDIENDKAVGLRNRWVDKPVQFIVFDNNHAGLMGEHSVMDGTPTVRLCDEVLEMLHDPAFDHGSALSSTPTPTPLDWEITPQISEAISQADKAAKELIQSQELGFLLTSYGKAEIKTFGVSPDSWAQMIVQLAYRRLNGSKPRIGATYEAATTRKFYKGRTEAIRSMDDPAVSIEQRKKLFNAAAKKHISLAKSAGLGQGVDRHLFGLKKLLRADEEVPALFTDPLYMRACYWSSHFPVYGWGEVNRLQYTITSRKEMPNARFCEEILKAADDLYMLHAGQKKSSL
ncbi:acyltransferase ChoActase/COT/CPT [Infundibulicybe gibba]|nr:acyltransferase ChoActase/COT/CPT [Infundibulicybe gibba]